MNTKLLTKIARTTMSVIFILGIMLGSSTTSVAAKSISPFDGIWHATDYGDESLMQVTILGPVKGPFLVTWTESYFTFCNGQAGLATGKGKINPNDPNILEADMRLKCFSTGSTVEWHQVWTYKPAYDVLASQDSYGVETIWTNFRKPLVPRMDLRVNYGHDWVEGFYEAGHNVLLTVKDGGGNVKAINEMVTESKENWGGATGFVTNDSPWFNADGNPMDNFPDIQLGDWVYVQVDNGLAAKVQIGDIQGEIDLDNDSISGTINALWFMDPVPVECLDWGSGAEQPFSNKDGGLILPDGAASYSCSWAGEWDVQAGQTIGVGYFGLDGHWVANAINAPNPRIVASESGNWFWTTDYYSGPLDISIYESAEVGSVLLWQGQSEADQWGFAFVGYDVHEQDLVPGNYLVVSDGVNEKGLVLETITMTVFDTEHEVMAGTAPLGREVRVSAGPQDWQEHIMVTADPNSGEWLADFNTIQFDITEDMRPSSFAQIFDEDGDANEASTPPNPWIEAFDWFDRYSLVDWPIGKPVNVTIENPNYTAEEFTPDGSTNWYDFFPGIDLQPGSIITATNGETTKVLEISSLSASVNPKTGKVTGVATPNRIFHMRTDGDSFQLPIEQDVNSGPTGKWSVTIDNYLPWKWFTRGEMWEGDEDGDVTYAIWHVHQEVVEVWLAQNELRAFDWPIGASLTFTVDGEDIATGVSPEPLFWMDGTGAFVNAGDLKLEPGMVVTVTDGSTSKSTIIQDIRITNIDGDNDVVYGYAPANADLELESTEDSPALRFFNADDEGNWMVDYREPSINGVTVDLNPGDELRLFMRDAEKDSTVWQRIVLNPRFDIRANTDQIEAWEWEMGEVLTLTINGDSEHPITQTVGEAPWDPNTPYAVFKLQETTPSFDIVPGDVVSLSNGVITKETTVTNLAFTDIDIDLDTVTGTAASNRQVDVWACDSFGCYNRHDTADGDGDWFADFKVPGEWENEQVIFNIIGGTWVDSQQVDEDGDKTMYGQTTSSFVVFPEWEWFDAINWPAGRTVTITVQDKTVQDKPECSTSYVSPGDFFNGGFGEGCNIATNDVVTFMDGDTTLTHKVKDLAITEVNSDEDTVSGTAYDGAVVVAWPHATGQQMQVTVTNGTWQVDFADVYDIKPNDCGRSQIMDDMGLATAVDWCAPNPRFSAFPEYEYVQGWEWPSGTSLSALIVEKSECIAESTIDSSGYFEFTFPSGCDMSAGDEVRLEDGDIIRTHTIRNLAVTDVDQATNSISGTADPGAQVFARVWGYPDLSTMADESGNWTIDFSDQGIVFAGGMSGKSEIPDEAGNATRFDWSVPQQPRQLSSANFMMEWSQTNPEEVISLSWKGSGNLTNIGGDLEYFGNSWVSENENTPDFFFASIVGWCTTGTWSQNGTVVDITSISSECPASADIPINTQYQFVEGKPDLIMIQRTFGFGDVPYPHDVRPFIPRLYPWNGFAQVLHPDATSDALITDDTCAFGCRLDNWNGTWFAIHNPTTGLGMIVQRAPSEYSVALWADDDGASNTNSSSFLLLHPVGGFTGTVSEIEYLCFYDDSIWTPSLTLPAECQP